MMKRYEEWAFKLVPALSFPDFIEKVQSSTASHELAARPPLTLSARGLQAESVGNMHLVFSQLSNYRDLEADKRETFLQRQRDGGAGDKDKSADMEKPAEVEEAPVVLQQPQAPAADDVDEDEDADGMYGQEEVLSPHPRTTHPSHRDGGGVARAPPSGVGGWTPKAVSAGESGLHIFQRVDSENSGQS